MPWNNQIIYYDEASETTKKINAAPGTTAYADNWKPFFKDFADHLDERDWFDDISLGFDERDNMLSVFNINKFLYRNRNFSKYICSFSSR